MQRNSGVTQAAQSSLSLAQTNKGWELLRLLTVQRAERLRQGRNRVAEPLSSPQIAWVPHQSAEIRICLQLALGDERLGCIVTDCTTTTSCTSAVLLCSGQGAAGAAMSHVTMTFCCPMGAPAKPGFALGQASPTELGSARNSGALCYFSCCSQVCFSKR